MQIDSAALQQGEKEGSVEPVKDGEVVKISGELLILAVGNGQQAGGGVRLCPGAGMHAQSSCSPLPSARFPLLTSPTSERLPPCC